MNHAPETSPPERAVTVVMTTAVRLSTIWLVAGLLLWQYQGDIPISRTILMAGLLTLMASPLLRLLLSGFEAIRQKDWFYFSSVIAVACLLAMTIAYALSKEFGRLD